MIDARTTDFLVATEEALRFPAPTQALNRRLSLVREALRVAHEEGEIELATQLIDLAEPAECRVVQVSALPIPERVLCELLYPHWRMTVEGSPPDEVFIAYRPIGWSGEGDPYERISAPTRMELLRLLAHRHLGRRPTTA